MRTIGAAVFAIGGGVLSMITESAGGAERRPYVTTAPTTQSTRSPIPKTLGVQIEFVRVPPGKITVRDRDGGSVERMVKPFWIGKYEVRWAEYDPFWMRQDTPQEQRARNVDAENRPRRPYTLPHRNWDVDQPARGVHVRSAKND